MAAKYPIPSPTADLNLRGHQVRYQTRQLLLSATSGPTRPIASSDTPPIRRTASWWAGQSFKIRRLMPVLADAIVRRRQLYDQ